VNRIFRFSARKRLSQTPEGDGLDAIADVDLPQPQFSHSKVRDQRFETKVGALETSLEFPAEFFVCFALF
jgi:hypothetical protein